MFTNETYLKKFLYLNMFYLRILKEHAYLIAAAMPAKNQNIITKAKHFNDQYNNLLKETMNIGAGIIDISDYMVTNYTLSIEKLTAFLTGIPIDTDLTILEINLATQPVVKRWDKNLINEGKTLNQKVIYLNQKFIVFKKEILEMIIACGIFINTYPSTIEHLLEELIHYNKLLTEIVEHFENPRLQLDSQRFWNDIMKDHADFLKGFLDPKEKHLIKLATYFSNQYDDLRISLSKNATNDINLKSINLTEEFRDFKAEIAEGIYNCDVLSIINPLLSDHILREANFYLYLLHTFFIK